MVYSQIYTVEDYKNKPPHPERFEGGLRVKGKFQKQSQSGHPLISIITVVRNGEATLEWTIQSVLNQTYSNIEYIVVDGGSTDRTLDIIRKHEDQITYWLSEPDAGISDGFNKGISLSTGDIIGIINSDDWYCTDAVELVATEYLQKKGEIFHGKLQYWNNDNSPYYIFSADDNKLNYYMSINHPTVFVCTEIYRNIGLFSLTLRNAMDYEWVSRAKLWGVKFYYIRTVIANMRLQGVSERFWLESYSEVKTVRAQHGMHPVENYMILAKMILTTLLRMNLEKIGLKTLVRLYRKYFSTLKKEAVYETTVEEK